ncbi:MAG: DJ-1 family glyoxalase III [Alloprevotella sp.]
MLHLFLANGFEEIEAITTLDILRRCGLEVNTVSVTGARLITGAHGIPIMADSIFRKNIIEHSNGLILPGGMPGARNLSLHDGLRKALLVHVQRGTLLAAICAAPLILGKYGLLDGKRATCYPGFESNLKGAIITENLVEEDGNIITGRGPAAAADFAFAIARRFVSLDKVTEVKMGMLLPR